MDFKDIANEWPWLAGILSALGIGAGGKGLLDKKQDKKIEQLENRMLKVEQDIKINDTRDEARDARMVDLKSEIQETKGIITELNNYVRSKL